jgi:hypothetical protein
MGTITIDQAITMFKARIAAYVAPVQKLGLVLTQAQFDALVSFCYNVGPQNLANLCRGRSVAQIGEAFDLYHKPPEITERRNKEKRLFQSGVYSSSGKVLVFPVSATHKPVYSNGHAARPRGACGPRRSSGCLCEALAAQHAPRHPQRHSAAVQAITTMHLHVLWDALKSSKLFQAGALLIVFSGLAEACDQIGAVDLSAVPYLGQYAPAIVASVGLAKVGFRVLAVLLSAYQARKDPAE